MYEQVKEADRLAQNGIRIVMVMPPFHHSLENILGGEHEPDNSSAKRIIGTGEPSRVLSLAYDNEQATRPDALEGRIAEKANARGNALDTLTSAR